MLAAKYMDDDIVSNDRYAKIGGIKKVEDINLLELEFLTVINYCLMVDNTTFNEILLSIELDEGRLLVTLQNSALHRTGQGRLRQYLGDMRSPFNQVIARLAVV